MVKYLIALSAFCLIQLAAGTIIRREAPAPIATPFSDFTKLTTDAISTLHTKFLQLMDVKNDQELTSLIETKSKTYASKLQALAVEFGEEAKKNSGKFDEALKSLTDKISATAADLKSKNPELFTETKKYEEALQNSMKAVLHETEVFANKLKTEGEDLSGKFEGVATKIYEATRNVASDLGDQLTEAIKEKKA